MSTTGENHPYTPAPWRAQGGWITADARYGVGGQACLVARIHSGPDCARPEHADGNARLIAAAPTLLDVAYRLNRYAGSHPGPVPRDLAEAIDLGGTAYAQVLGGRLDATQTYQQPRRLGISSVRYEGPEPWLQATAKRSAGALSERSAFAALVGVLSALAPIDETAAAAVVNIEELPQDTSVADINYACEQVVNAFMTAVESRVAARVRRQIRNQGER